MKVDRRYILLGQFNRRATVDGSDFFSIDLRDIMGYLYDKYSRFSIKLEAYHSRVANSSTRVGDEVQFLHVGGFNWLNGYDTNPLYQGSRVAGVLYFQHESAFLIGEFNRQIIYPSNIATLIFSRQASSRIYMELFATTADSNLKLDQLFGSESPNYLFSITGVDDAYPIYREPEIIENTSQLVLNTANATSLETNRRAVRWRVDLSQVIDRNVYNKYIKFVLITKMILTNNTYWSFSSFVGSTNLVSGLNWVSPCLKLNSSYTGTTSWLNLYHEGAVTAISLTDNNTTGDTIKETFIDNVFFKPASPIINFTMTYNTINTLNLIGVTQAIEPMVYIFNILPVDD